MAKATSTSATGAKAKKEYVMKYEDKSAGQPEMAAIFLKLKSILLPYGKGMIKIVGGDGGQLSLISTREVEVDGKKKSELWFAAILVQKGYVGFYYMPVYTHPDIIRQKLSPDLLKLLKGKSCFHIKKLDPTLLSQIEQALKTGYDLWKKENWV